MPPKNDCRFAVGYKTPPYGCINDVFDLQQDVGWHFIPLARGQVCRRKMTVGLRRACPRPGGVQNLPDTPLPNHPGGITRASPVNTI